MSLVSKYPLVRPSQVVNFGKKTLLNSAVSYSRGSSGTYVDSNGLIRSAVVGEPRFTHDPDTLESLGLLVEESRTNLLTYSEEFDNNIAYIKDAGVSVTPNSTTSPAGTTSADLISVLNNGRIYANNTSVTAVCSVYIKAGTFSHFRVFGCLVDLTVPSTTAGSLVSVGNGWYRLASEQLTTSRHFQVQAYPDNTYSIHSQSGTYYIWGAQLEEGASPTSYIPTTTSAVTRAADHLSVPSSTARSGRIIFTPTSSASPPVFALKSSDPSPTIPYEVDFSTFNSVPYGSVSYNSVRQGAVAPSSVPTSLPSVSALAFNFDKTTGALDLSTTATADEDSKVISLPAELSRPAPDGYELDVLDVNGGGGIALKEIYLWPEDLSVDKLASVSGELRSIGQAAETSTGFNTASDYRDSGARPSLDLRFAERKDLFDSTTEQNLVDFSRGSIGTYVDSNGVIQTAVDDEPRFDHDPETGDSLGLLVEESRTNYQFYSEQIGLGNVNAGYGLEGLDFQANIITAPDGTLTADKVFETATTNRHVILINQLNLKAGEVTGGFRVLSMFAKAAEKDLIRFSTAFYPAPTFNLSTGTISEGPPECGIEKLNDGWYRCWVAIPNNQQQYIISFGTTFLGSGYLGDGVSGLYIWGVQIEAGSFPTSYIPTPATFTSRASPATYYDANGIIQTAGPDVARDNAYFPDENGIFRPAGLLLEGARTNGSTFSSVASSWFDIGGQTTNTQSNITTAPDGTSEADNIYGASGNWTAKSLWGSTLDVPNNSYLVMSIFAKKVPSSKYEILNLNINFVGAGGPRLACNLTTGVVIPNNGVSGYSQKLPNGWYRFVAFLQNTTGSTQTWSNSNALRIFATTSTSDDAGIGSGTGSTTDGVYVWGRQTEVSTFPYATSYIPTTNSEGDRAVDNSTSDEVTRVADEASITGTNFSSWYRQSEGSFFAESKLLGFSTFAFTASAIGPDGYVDAPHRRQTDNVFYSVLHGPPGNTNQVLLVSQITDLTSTSKGANAFKTNDYAYCLDGGTVLVDNLFNLPSPTRLSVGSYDGNFFLNGTISRLTYWPTRLSDATLQALTDPATSTWDLIFDPSLSPDGVCAIITFGTTTYEVDWGDGTPVETINATGTYTATHRYTFPTTYTAKIDVVSGTFRPYYNNSTYADYLVEIKKTPDGWTNTSTSGFGTNLERGWWGANNLTKIDREIDTTGVTNVSFAWTDCSQLTRFPLINTSSVSNFFYSWLGCSSLTSFPLIDTSAGTDFRYSWYNCNSLTSFPLIDTSLGENFTSTWYVCNNLTSFPQINTSLGKDFANTWRSCTSLTSFPLLDTSSGTNFGYAWFGCTSLATFPASMFDTTGTLISAAFSQTFSNCALTSQSIGNILSSLDTNGQSNITLSINGGTNASSYDWGSDAWNGFYNLVSKGWTISYNDNLFSSSPLDLQFAATKTLDSRITFSRGTIGTYVDENGIIQTAAADVPRFDHDPETGESLGLLVEEQRTNLLTYSEDATNWGYNSLTPPTAPTTEVTSPAGVQSAFKLLETTDVNEHWFRLAEVTAVIGNTYTYSIYIKPTLGRTKIRVYSFAQNNLTFIWDLVNNLEISVAGGTSPSISSTAVGDGWYRLVFTDEATQNAFRPSLMTVTDSNEFQHTGDVTKGFYVWGAQLEDGAFPTSYIATDGTLGGVIRSADEASITGTNFTSFFNAAASTLYTDYTINDGNSLFTRFPATINNGTSNNFYLRPQHRPNAAFARVESIHTVTTGIKDIDHSKLKRNKLAAFVVEGSEIGGALNGSLEKIGGADPEGVSYAQTQLSIGQIPFTSPYQLHISRLTYWPKRLPDGALQFITS